MKIRTTSFHHADRSQTRARASAFLTAILVLAATAQAGTNGFTIVRPTPGGIYPGPIITNVADTGDLLIEWLGFQPPYQLQKKTALDGAAWMDIGTPTSGNSALAPKQGATGFLRIRGASPPYEGAQTCFECHGSAHAGWLQTTHAGAYQTLKAINQHNNAECLVCHTVGYGMPSGFINEATTPHLAAVQCENCHGPAADHVTWAMGGGGARVVPVKTESAMLCGGCHNGFHHPTYDEWQSSAHSVVVDAEAFLNPDRAAAVARMNSCGACHSGAVRLAMLEAYTKNVGNARTNVAWPSGLEAAETSQSCVVCHDTHDTHKYTNVVTGTVYTNQLRNPLTSTNTFSYNTGTNFASQYNPAVSICGQCHNARGATVGSSSRPPHYSPQYNVFLGIIGVTTNAAPPQGAHKNNARQCAGCHTHRHNEQNPDPENPAYTGHTFRPTIEACAVCHTEPTGPLSATNLLFTTQSEISGMIATTKGLLDLWATTKNTNAWASKYEARGWEYTNPGELSNPSGSTSIVGPNNTEQGQIPQGIKDARFNLYLVNRDKSKGVHNAPYTRYLLSVAQQRVNTELHRP
jgi:hypothetical protein